MNIGERFSAFYEKLISNTTFMVAVIVCVFALTVLYYYIVKFLKNNNAGGVIFLVVCVMIITGGITVVFDEIPNMVFLAMPLLIVILVVSLYSTEIKRVIWSKKNMKLVDVHRGDGNENDAELIHNCIAEIIKALQNMSKNDIGAIIVLSNGNVPAQILDSGVKLDCDISSALIESVFFPKTPLHDGAMIISGTRIVAAGCFLPLSQKMDNIPKDLGTRHRAGIGITETIDVTSLIVSEETGIISIVKAGKITRYADFEMLKNTLSKFYWQELDTEKK